MQNYELDLITVDEICEILGCGANSVYKLLNAHKIPAFKIGKNWKIPREGVKKFILEQLEQSGFSQTSDIS